ncbi:hypothetical protein EL753P1_00051 [Eggerthella phage EL753P1]|nr:hypothetical protein EL753P1_00051 [Eggerthella phage EL753P1]
MYVQCEDGGIWDLGEVFVLYLREEPALALHAGQAFVFFDPEALKPFEWRKVHAWFEDHGYPKLTAAEFKVQLGDPESKLLPVSAYSYQGFRYERSARNGEC